MNKTYYIQLCGIRCIVKPTIFMSQLDTLYLSVYVNHKRTQHVYGTVLWYYANNIRIVEWLQLKDYDKITFALDLQYTPKVVRQKYFPYDAKIISHEHFTIRCVQDAIEVLQSTVKDLYVQ